MSGEQAEGHRGATPMSELDELEVHPFTIAGSCVAHMSAMPDRPFLLDRDEPLSIPPEVARCFSIERIRVGNNDVMLPGPPVSCAWFAYHSAALLMLTDVPVCEIGNLVTLTVRNETPDPQLFKCSLRGRYAPEPK